MKPSWRQGGRGGVSRARTASLFMPRKCISDVQELYSFLRWGAVLPNPVPAEADQGIPAQVRFHGRAAAEVRGLQQQHLLRVPKGTPPLFALHLRCIRPHAAPPPPRPLSPIPAKPSTLSCTVRCGEEDPTVPPRYRTMLPRSDPTVSPQGPLQSPTVLLQTPQCPPHRASSGRSPLPQI